MKLKRKLEEGDSESKEARNYEERELKVHFPTI